MVKKIEQSDVWGQVPMHITPVDRQNIDDACSYATEQLGSVSIAQDWKNELRMRLESFITERKRLDDYPNNAMEDESEPIGAPMPRGKNLRDLFVELHQSSNRFYEALIKIGAPEFRKILCKDMYNLTISPDDHLGIDAQFDNMFGAAKVSAPYFEEKALDALAGLPKDKGGPVEDITFKSFIQDMESFYREATDKDPKVYYSEYNEGYVGDFLPFLFGILDKLNYPYISKNALGKAIVRTHQS